MIWLQSPLAVDDCLERLTARTDSPWKLFGQRPVIGWASGQRFYAWTRVTGRNSFRPCLKLEFGSIAQGTSIGCKFGLHPTVAMVLAIFIGFACIGGVTELVQAIGKLSSPTPPDGVWVGVIIPPLMIIFGPALAAGGWWWASGDKSILLRFVSTTLQVSNPSGTA
jgi:hypothetical protein